MKLSKEELLSKINDKITDEEIKVELIEDISDSFDLENEENKELEQKYNDLLEKYKERFLKTENSRKEDEDEDEDEEKEKTIDIKEI